MWQYDVDVDGTLEDAERYYFMHDERWRVIGTFRNQDASPKEAFVHHAAGQGGVGGSSYIDSIILRDRDNYTSTTPNPMSSAGDGTLEERRYYCQNWRADVVAITKSDGTPLEYVRYSAYGEPTVYPVADLDMDGDVDTADSNEWDLLFSEQPDQSAYATADIDFDGSPSTSDGDLFAESYTANTGLNGKGRLSSPSIGNRLGYAGYHHDPVTRLYDVRHRWYFPEIGRWGRRDPIGEDFASGGSQYGYVASRSLRFVDALGLYAVTTGFAELCEQKSCTKRIPKERRKEFDRDILDTQPFTGGAWYGVAYCDGATASVCFNCEAIRSKFTRPRYKGTRSDVSDAVVDRALGAMFGCIEQHEQAHVTDIICDSTPGYKGKDLKYRSGDRTTSEHAAYKSERACLDSALKACGNEFYCQSVIINAMQRWNSDSQEYNSDIDPLKEFDLNKIKADCGWAVK